MHISALPGDYYHFDQAKQRLIGERTRQIFQLGGAVTVRIARVDLDDRKIDLELAGAALFKRGRSGKSGQRRSEEERASVSRNRPSRGRENTSSKDKESSGRGRNSGRSSARPSKSAKASTPAESKKASTSGRSAKGSKAGKASGVKHRAGSKSPAGRKRR